MTNTGTSFEYKVRDYLQALGYFVMRSAGSKGAFDLIAWNGNEVLVIQCKKEIKKRGAYSTDLSQMAGVVVPKGWKKQLWVKTKREVKVHDIDGFKIAFMKIEDINKVIKLGH